ncbi:R8 protein [Rhodotorula sphaerocarpa]
MFYSTEILTSRKEGLAVFWLAATVGSRGGTAVRKLSKKELLGCDVVKACEKVREPEEPLALRLSSNLLMGIARVFSQQYTIYAADVQQLEAALKRVISESVAAKPDTTLAPLTGEQVGALSEQVATQAAKEGAGHGGINLKVTHGLTYIGYDPDLDLGLDWRLPGEAEPEMVDDIDEPPLVTPDISDMGTPAKKDRKLHQAREEDIRLHEPQLEDYLLKHAARDGQEFELGGGQDLGMVFGEGEQGLLEGISPVLDAVIRAGSAASGYGGSQLGQMGMPASSSAVGAAEDLGGMEQQFFDFDFGGEGYGLGAHQGDLAASLDPEEQVRLEMEAARARLSDTGKQRSITPLEEGQRLSGDFLGLEGPPSSTTQRRVSEALEQVKGKAAEKKRSQKSKSIKRLPIDRNIDLEEAKIKDMRQTYGERMHLEREKANQTRLEREAHQRAVDLVFGAPSIFAAPLLSNCARRVVKKAGAKVEAGGREGTAEPERARREAGKRLSELQGAALGLQPAEDFAADFLDNQDFGGEGYGQEGDLGGLDEFRFDEEVEQGRAASAAGRTASQRASLLPWAGEAATSDIGGDFGGASSAAGGSKVSLEAGVEYLRRSRSPSLLPSPGRGGSVGALLQEDVEAAAAKGSLSPRASGLAVEEPALAEHESLKFLSYARRQASSSVATGKGGLTFSDIVPIETTAAPVAAQALYHLLGLATKGMVHVKQPIAYGEIEVTLL